MGGKNSTYYVCSNCGHKSSKWLGRCPSCDKWNTFEEEVVVSRGINAGNEHVKISKPINIEEIEANDVEVRLKTGYAEFDRVLGGGIVPGEIVLLGGEPGIGKSTLMLQTAMQLGDKKVLYVSGEENQRQIKLRYDRIAHHTNKNIFILNETDIDVILKYANELEEDLLIIDSIQTVYDNSVGTTPGSVSQIRQCTYVLQQYAKKANVPVFLIGHITKDGVIAGPKIMEHIVDAVVMFEGERDYGFRILRTIKNRFGSASELGIYLMDGSGLTEVTNPSEILISKNVGNLSGICLGATMEGLRPIIVEVQALVSTAAYGMPQRTTTGFDNRRLNMLLAVLEKRCNIKLSSKDVFLNITGGIKIDDTAIDMAVACAIISSITDVVIDKSCCFAGEIGLTGEIRPVTNIEKRLSEAAKIGFKSMFVSGVGLNKLKVHTDIKIIGVNKLDELFRIIVS